VSFRGINPNSNTIQVWTGSAWVPFNTLTLTTTGSDAVLGTTGNLEMDAGGNFDVDAASILLSASSALTGTATTGNVTLTATAGNASLTGGGTATLQGAGATTVESTGANVEIMGATTVDVTATAGDITLDAGANDLIVTAANTVLSGNLVVNGTSIAVNSENVNVEDAHLALAVGYTVATGRPAGLVVNYEAIGTATTVATGGFNVAGTVEVADTTGFSVNDIIQVSGTPNATNSGFFAISAITPGAPGTLTIKSTPANQFLQNAFVTDATATGAVVRVNLSVIQAGTDGIWEVGQGASDALAFTFQDLATAAGVNLQQAYENGNTITTSAGEGPLTFTGTETIQLTSGSGNIALNTGTGDVNVGSAGEFTASAASNIELTTSGGNVVLTSDTAAVNVSGVNVGVLASADISMTAAGNVSMGATAGDFTVGAGDAVTLTAGATGTAKMRVGVNDALVLDSATTASIAAGYLLSWDGTKNIYVDPSGYSDTLQSAYENGNTITTSAGEGPLTVTGTESISFTSGSGNFDVTVATGSILLATTGTTLSLTGRTATTLQSSTANVAITAATDIEVAATANVDVRSGASSNIELKVGTTSAIVLDSTTTASVAAGRILTWNGTQNVYVDPAAPTTETWAQTLVAGNVSGGTDPTLTSGDKYTSELGAILRVATQANAGATDQIIIESGTATGGNSGAVNITTGIGNSTGGIALTTGNASVGDSGGIAISVGNAPANGGVLMLSAGSSTTSGDGGDVTFTAGSGAGASGSGGYMNLSSGYATGLNGSGGEFTVNSGPGGNATGTGTGGYVDISAGDSVDGNAGNLSLNAGDASGTGNAGTIYLTAGTGNTTKSGDVVIEAPSSASGTDGIIQLYATQGYVGIGSPILRAITPGDDLLFQTANMVAPGASGDLTIATGAMVGGVGVGSGAISIATAANFGATGTSGKISLTTGGGNAGSSGNVEITTGSGDTAGSGSIKLTTGPGSGGPAGNIEITAGAGGASTAGGLVVNCGDGASGGGITLIGGDSSSGSAGSFSFTAGDSTAGGSGGGISLLSGDSDGGDSGDIIIDVGSATNGATGNGGQARLKAGSSVAGVGGDLDLLAGDGPTGGNVSIEAGDTTTTGTGGNLLLLAGDGGGLAGTALLKGGSSSGAAGGSVEVSGGTGTTVGGAVVIRSGTGLTPGSVQVLAGTVTSAVFDSTTDFTAAAALSVLRKNAGGTALEYAPASSFGTPYSVQTVAANTSISAASINASEITVACTAGSITITIPDPSTVTDGKRILVKDRNGNAAANNITITTAAGTIDGAASQLIATNYGSLTLQRTSATTWSIV
jgi:hypothetical protein